MSEERNDTIILGRKIGTNVGWDIAGDYAVQFVSFISCVDGIPNCDSLSVDFETGILTAYHDAFEISISYDVISALQSVPMIEPQS